jgi:hypothetical protein
MVEILQRARLLPLRPEPSARGAFPTLPERSQFNRLVRFHAAAIEEIALHLAQMIEGERCLYQALDASAMPVRDMPSVVAMAGFCRTGRHRLVQQPGLVGGFLFAHCG